jgi:hypothetical protein
LPPRLRHEARHEEKMMRRAPIIAVFLLAFLGASLFAREAVLTRSEIQDGWILLFDSETMFGLFQEGPLSWKATDGSLVAEGSAPGYIHTTSPFPDFVLKMEFMFATPSGKGTLFFRTAKGNIPTDNGYRIPLTDEDANWPAGSIVQRAGAKRVRPAAGQWHSLQVEAEGSHLTVWIDEKKVGEANDPSSRAGYIGLKVESGCRFEFRNLKLKPLTDTNLFNGSDLGGWKIATPKPPEKKPSKLKKIIPFAGGGKPNIKQSDWSVKAGAIHGEKGPGQLETTAMYDDFVLQFQAVNLPAKSQPGHAGIYIRGDAGSLFTGYSISMDPERPGAIGPGLAAPRKIVPIGSLAVGTVAVSGRHFAVWINGFPVTEFVDTRAEGGGIAKDAKTAAGTVALPLHDASQTADYSRMQLTMLSKSLGGVIGKAPPPPPAPVAVAPAAVPPVAAPASASSANANANTAAQIIAAQQQSAQQEALKRQKASELMTQAIRTSDPVEQERLYTQVIQLDPTILAAYQGVKDAQAKQEAQRKEAEKQQVAQNEAKRNEARKEDALNRAEQAFLRGDFQTASGLLAIAEQIDPGDGRVRGLRSKINEAMSQGSRLRYLLLGGGLLGVGGLSTFFLLRRGRKQGYLEIVSGLERGHRYDLNQSLVRIGAIGQDGAGKNDIVIRDVEHMISRFHCEIHSQDGKFYVIDCNSANGTRVDKKRVRGEPQRLKNGAQLELGGTTTLRFGLERRKVKS